TERIGIRFTNLGPSPDDGCTVTPDFSGSGATRYLLEVYNHDVLVASFPGHSGEAAKAGYCPGGGRCWPNAGYWGSGEGGATSGAVVSPAKLASVTAALPKSVLKAYF